MTCPKCGTTQREQPACPRCGLAVARMAAFTTTRDAAIPAPLLAAWQRVREDWGDPALHDALLQLTVQHESYAWAAAKYREVARMRTNDAVAEAQLERLRRATEVSLAIMATARPEAPGRSYGALKVMLLFVAASVVGSMVYARVRNPDTMVQTR